MGNSVLQNDKEQVLAILYSVVKQLRARKKGNLMQEAL